MSASEIDIDADLVESVIKEIKCGKAPGLDGITAEHRSLVLSLHATVYFS